MTYDTDLGQFLRTFNVRYVHDNKMFELPIVATCWAEAEAMLRSVKASGIVHSELLEVME